MKITDTTALNVLVNHSREGATESDFFHSKIYHPSDTLTRLRQKGYHIQERMAIVAGNAKEMRWFVDTQQVRDRALQRRNRT